MLSNLVLSVEHLVSELQSFAEKPAPGPISDGHRLQTAKSLGDRALSGPCFGKDEKHVVVSTTRGIVETQDAGATWQLVTSYQPDAPEIELGWDKYGHACPSIGYDAKSDVFYLFLFKPGDKGQLLKYARR